MAEICHHRKGVIQPNIYLLIYVEKYIKSLVFHLFIYIIQTYLLNADAISIICWIIQFSNNGVSPSFSAGWVRDHTKADGCIKPRIVRDHCLRKEPLYVIPDDKSVVVEELIHFFFGLPKYKYIRSTAK